MNKIKITLVFLLFFSFSFSQSLEETIEWINRNSNGREQVEYDKEENVLDFYSYRQAGNLESTLIREVNIVDISSISLVYNDNGWHSVKLNFKKGGTNVRSFIMNKNSEIVGEPTETTMYGFEYKLKCSRELIEKYKKAFLNLFKEIGVEVKDGDYF